MQMYWSSLVEYVALTRGFLLERSGKSVKVNADSPTPDLIHRALHWR